MDLTETANRTIDRRGRFLEAASTVGRFTLAAFRHAAAGFLGLVILYLSLVITSAPMASHDRQAVERAVAVLESKGFYREAFLLRHAATFRSSDNWLNTFVPSEKAFAATNYPFGIITIYPDFYAKAADDTERAMILLHEARHLQGGDEADAYSYVWRNRQQLGWTQLSHGQTDTYTTIELQTRENAPGLFTCQTKVWSDCTETLLARR